MITVVLRKLFEPTLVGRCHVHHTTPPPVLHRPNPQTTTIDAERVAVGREGEFAIRRWEPLFSTFTPNERLSGATLFTGLVRFIFIISKATMSI